MLSEVIPYTIPYWQGVLSRLREEPYRWYKRLNTIVDFFEFSCGGNLVLYVQTLLPALGNMFLTLLDFDYDDVLRGMLRPYGPYARKSLVFSPRKAKWQWEVPELGEEIGKRIPGAKFIKASKVAQATRFLWIVDGIIQRAFYYWLLLDVVGEFLYNWASGILRSEACLQDGFYVRGGYYGDSGGDGEHSVPLGGFQSKVVNPPPPDGSIQIGGGWIGFSRPGAILMAYTLHPFFPLQCRAEFRLFIRDDAGRILDVSPWERSGSTNLFVARIPRPGIYYPRAWVRNSSCYVIAWGLEALVAKTY